MLCFASPSFARALTSIRPAADVIRGAKEYLVEFELPGVKKGDITMNAHDNVFELTASKNAAKAEGMTRDVEERLFGTYEARYDLPSDVNIHGINGALHDGILTVHFPRNAPKKVEIKLE